MSLIMLRNVIGIFVAYILTAISMQTVYASDFQWSDTELRIIQSLSIERLPEPPASPSNKFAGNKDAALLGQALFFDESLSGNGKQSCASCHLPNRYFTDGRPRSGGPNSAIGRNTPTIVGVAHQNWFYWDGRRDSLWSQALIPFEAPNEMDGSRVSVLKRISQTPALNDQYRQVFGRTPYLPDSAVVLQEGAGPHSAEPARSNWHRLTARTKARINRSYANVGKAIAAYVRTLQPLPSRFDQYVSAVERHGEVSAEKHITAMEKSGLKLFITDSKTQCLRCHLGPRFTNEGFQNVGSGTFEGDNLDFGRILGVQSVLRDEFNCLSRYSDARKSECHSLRFMNRDPHQPQMGAFKTPSLRNVGATSPYFHDGRYQSLAQVIAHYVQPPNSAQNAVHELKPIALTKEEIRSLVSFLKMLSEPSIETQVPPVSNVTNFTNLRR